MVDYSKINMKPRKNAHLKNWDGWVFVLKKDWFSVNRVEIFGLGIRGRRELLEISPQVSQASLHIRCFTLTPIHP